MMKRLMIILCVGLLVLPLAAQTNSMSSIGFDTKNLVQKPVGFLDALMHSDKFQMSHSYSLSYYSIGHQGGSMGLYVNTMSYQLADPLKMSVSVGYLHQPFGGPMQDNNGKGEVFLESARLEYKPTNNMSITVDYRQMPQSIQSLYSPYSPYHYNPFNR